MSREPLVRLRAERRSIPAHRGIYAHLAAGALILLLGSNAPVYATDYFVSQKSNGVSFTAHTKVIDCDAVLQIATVSKVMCAGEEDCCCVKPPNTDCCHHVGLPKFHQTCCTFNGSPDPCTGTGGICSVKITRARLCLVGSKCTFPGSQVAVICDDGDPFNLCPAAGDRVDTTLTLGFSDLCSLNNDCLEIFVEFDNGQDLSAPVEANSKDPPCNLDCSAPCPTATIPTVSNWGLAGLSIALAAAAAVVIVGRNRREAHNA